MRKDAIEEGQQVWCSMSLLGAMELYPELWFTYIFAWSTLTNSTSLAPSLCCWRRVIARCYVLRVMSCNIAWGSLPFTCWQCAAKLSSASSA